MQMTEIEGGRHRIDDTDLVLLQVMSQRKKQIQNINTHKYKIQIQRSKISVQMTEIEGGRHRIDDTDLVLLR